MTWVKKSLTWVKKSLTWVFIPKMKQNTENMFFVFVLCFIFGIKTQVKLFLTQIKLFLTQVKLFLTQVKRFVTWVFDPGQTW